MESVEGAKALPSTGQVKKKVMITFTVVAMAEAGILLLMAGEIPGNDYHLLCKSLVLALFAILAFGLLALTVILRYPIGGPQTHLPAWCNYVQELQKNRTLVAFVVIATAVTVMNFLLTGKVSGIDGHNFLFPAFFFVLFVVMAIASGILILAMLLHDAPGNTEAAASMAAIV